MSELLNKKALCQWLGITTMTLHNWERKHIIPPGLLIGQRLYYSREAVRDWISSLRAAQSMSLVSVGSVRIPVPLETSIPIRSS